MKQRWRGEAGLDKGTAGSACRVDSEKWRSGRQVGGVGGAGSGRALEPLLLLARDNGTYSWHPCCVTEGALLQACGPSGQLCSGHVHSGVQVEGAGALWGSSFHGDGRSSRGLDRPPKLTSSCCRVISTNMPPAQEVTWPRPESVGPGNTRCS